MDLLQRKRANSATAATSSPITSHCNQVNPPPSVSVGVTVGVVVVVGVAMVVGVVVVTGVVVVGVIVGVKVGAGLGVGVALAAKRRKRPDASAAKNGYFPSADKIIGSTAS